MFKLIKAILYLYSESYRTETRHKAYKEKLFKEVELIREGLK